MPFAVERRRATISSQRSWPIPEAALQEALGGVRGVGVAELNDGQMLREIERLACAPACPAAGLMEVCGVHRLDGELITPQQILERGGLL